MARLDFEDSLDQELTRVYLAAYLSEAKCVEETLTNGGVDYAVALETYLKPVYPLFALSVHVGASFFVASERAAFARSTLLAAGLKVGIEEEDGEEG
ncbi:MAG: hypothetical protein ABSB82_22175 [Terriglobia bacterium]|jgi:hypothetical protein